MDSDFQQPDDKVASVGKLQFAALEAKAPRVEWEV